MGHTGPKVKYAPPRSAGPRALAMFILRHLFSHVQQMC